MGLTSSDEDREELRIVIGVALAMTRRKVRRDFAEIATWSSEPAQLALSESIADAVLTHFDLTAKPDPDDQPSPHTRYMGQAEPEDD